MEPTGCESCGSAKGLALQGVKSLKIDRNTLETVIYSPKLKVADIRNRSAIQKKTCGSVHGSCIRRHEPPFLKLLKRSFAQLHKKVYKHYENILNRQPHIRVGGQPASWVCYCHVTRGNCVPVVSFVKALGLSPLRSLGVWVFTSLPLHRSEQESKVF